MKEDLYKLITCTDVQSVYIVKDLAEKYNCSVEKIYWKVRSIFGKKLKDLRWDFREPNKEQFIRDILLCDTAVDLRKKYSFVSHEQWKGVYDRILGVSTFLRAKEQAMLELLPIVYTPTTDNNLAMWAACRLGDGSFCSKRRAWKIEHCAKQREWLEKKVSMFIKSFPNCSTVIKHNEKRNTFSWYSKAIGYGKFYTIGTCKKAEVVKHLNEFGLWWLFLDDGCYFNKGQQKVSYAVENMEIGIQLLSILTSMGFNFRIANKNEVCMTGVQNIIPFFKRILQPFRQQTPACMQYKISYVKI